MTNYKKNGKKRFLSGETQKVEKLIERLNRANNEQKLKNVRVAFNKLMKESKNNKKKGNWLITKLNLGVYT